jgi:outer membrane protein OmpA-like peptidoglycan-associated protein
MKTGMKRVGANRFIAIAAIGLGLSTGSAFSGNGEKAIGENYVPAIWVDPDGCEHFVMDDGWEGFMTPNVKPNGRPVCHSGDTCASLSSDSLFGSGGSRVGATNRATLINFFQTANAKSFIINGHTDSQASDAHNVRLSRKRAQAVADIAMQAGADVFYVRGYGERAPKATNGTGAGRAANRRVEIICVH